MIRELLELQKTGVITKKELADRIAKLRLPYVIGALSKSSTYAIVASMWMISFLIISMLLELSQQLIVWQKYSLYALAPLLFAVCFLSVGMVWAQIGKVGIVEGKFPRLVDHPIYALRRIYGTAWTQVYYFKPLYAVCLAIPALKYILFRGYGYRGSLDVTLYPDTWIRDLPLLDIASGVYISNRSTMGTNMCLNDGTVVVGKIKCAEGAMIGHLATVAPGVVIGKKTEVGVGTGVGIRANLGENVFISPRVVINHASNIGNNVVIGNSAYIGIKVTIADNIKIKPGASIPAGVHIKTQSDADAYFSSEQQDLSVQKDSILRILTEQLKHGSKSASS